MVVKYYYQNNKSSKIHEVMIDIVAEACSQHIELPDSIEVCLYKFDDNTYGGVDKHTYNRLGINIGLTLEEIPKIVVHELLHVHQRHTGKLSIKHNTYYWLDIPYHNVDEQVNYQDYKNSPWEVDVENRLDDLLSKVLQMHS